ncbi:aminotransferase class V-fold PLP-dependent enzyme [Nocardiopsis sp. NPDC050513]|uniref:aminotransferase class V-fold PLP-dependent enzyme n=1 Tax=Nocardiopsis sp. NPDC050513 TaxID=3364338 RepID=UPI00378A65A1
MIDIEAARADTPGCRGRIFLDSAGSSLPPAPVLDEVIAHLRREAEIGGYRAYAERAEDVEAGHTVFADLLGCAPDEVAFTDSATRSWLTLAGSVPLGAGDRVLVTEAEYGANAVALLRLAERAGASVEVVPSDSAGAMSVEALRAMLDERVKLLSLVHVPTNSGLTNPVRETVKAAHEVDALVLLDACQSVGQLPVRMDDLGVDMLSGTGRKWLRGPRGTGFLAVRRSAADRLRPLLVDHSGAEWDSATTYRLRDDARVHQLWEYGVAERLGLIAAARYALDLGVEAVAAAVADRAGRLRRGLDAIAGVEVADLGAEHNGIVTFTCAGEEPRRVAAALWDAGVAVTVSPRASTRFDMERRGLEAVVRASPHYFVSHGDIDRAVEALAGILRNARGDVR